MLVRALYGAESIKYKILNTAQLMEIRGQISKILLHKTESKLFLFFKKYDMIIKITPCGKINS